MKEVDGHKIARCDCDCDGSTRAGQDVVLDHTYANGLDQTGSRILYAIAAAENHAVYGADATNAFGEAGAPKQGFYILLESEARKLNSWVPATLQRSSCTSVAFFGTWHSTLL